MKKMYTTLFIAFLFIKCTPEPETIIEYQIINEVETVTVTETVTEVQNVIVAPEEYSFTRNGVSTVYYTGQTARLKMATQLKSAMNDLSYSQTRLDSMFNLGKGFSDLTLDASGKKVGNKTAASPIASATIKSLFDGWIEEFTNVVVPAINQDVTASSGVAGSYTEADGSRTVKVNAKGFELNQIFSKGLIGALQLDQIINGYLSFSKLDGARQDHEDEIYAYTFPGQTTASITKMEHYWDEGFGYLQGLDSQYSSGLGDPTTGRDTANLNYYLNKVNNQANEEGISERIYQAFTIGRAAIVAKDYDERDRQAAIISTELSKVIGYKAQSYLRDGAEDIENGDWADALHALSEAYGFILGLQFTKNTAGNPFMSNQEVSELLESLSSGDGGFWERTPSELNLMADQIREKTGLSLE